MSPSPSELIIAGRPFPINAPVRTWHETGLCYTPAAMRRETRWIVTHWTGAENAAERAFHNMAARHCSVHFVVDQLGVIYQFADAQARLAHAKPQTEGDALSGNSYGVGIEIVNRGDGTAPEKTFARPRVHTTIHKRRVTYADFYPQQVASVIALCAALCDAYSLPLAVPMSRGQVFPTVLPRSYLERFRGVVGHYQLDRSKNDPAPELLEKIARAGEGAPPLVS